MKPDGQILVGAAQDGAQLVRVQVVVEAQHQEIAVLTGEAQQCATELLAIEGQCERVQGQVIGSILAGHVYVPERNEALATAGAIRHRSRGDAVQPAAERLVWEIRVSQVLERSLERHRGEVLSHGSFPDSTVDEGMDARKVRVVEFAVGSPVITRAFDELTLAVR